MTSITSAAIPLTKTNPDNTPVDPSLPNSPLLFSKLQSRAKRAIKYLNRRKKKKEVK